MNLIIAEKPSVAQTIAAVLGAKERKDGYIEGAGYLVSWCVGHLVGLFEAAAYGEQYKKWSYEALPILPQEWKYTVAADKQKQFKILKDLMRRTDVFEVINACDAGREGELIFRFVYLVAGCKNLCAAFGFPLWRTRYSRKVLICSKTGGSMTPFSILPYAGRKPIGLSVSTRPAFSLVCMERP